MANFFRVAKKALAYTSARFGWWLLVVLQSSGLWFFGLSLKRQFLFSGMGGFAALGLVAGAFATTRLWLEIQAEHQSDYSVYQPIPGMLTRVYSRAAWGVTGQMAVAGFLLFVIRFFLQHWAVRILVVSLCLVYFLGVMLFWVIFRQSLINSIWLSWEMWHKRAQVPGVFTLVLMLSNAMAFSLARFGISSLLSGGFSGLGDSAKLWLLATVFVLFAIAILVWLNVFLVIGFLEFVGSKKSRDPQLAAAQANAWVAVLGK